MRKDIYYLCIAYCSAIFAARCGSEPRDNIHPQMNSPASEVPKLITLLDKAERVLESGLVDSGVESDIRKAIETITDEDKTILFTHLSALAGIPPPFFEKAVAIGFLVDSNKSAALIRKRIDCVSTNIVNLEKLSYDDTTIARWKYAKEFLLDTLMYSGVLSRKEIYELAATRNLEVYRIYGPMNYDEATAMEFVVKPYVSGFNLRKVDKQHWDVLAALRDKEMLDNLAGGLFAKDPQEDYKAAIETIIAMVDKGLSKNQIVETVRSDYPRLDNHTVDKLVSVFIRLRWEARPLREHKQKGTTNVVERTGQWPGIGRAYEKSVATNIVERVEGEKSPQVAEPPTPKP